MVEANDMDKLMRLDCPEDYRTACRTCNTYGPECPKKKEKREQYKGIDDWELREPEDFYGKAVA